MKKQLLAILPIFLCHQYLSAELQQATIKVGGIVCTACVSPLQNVLKNVPGIAGTPSIDLTQASVSLTLQPENRLTLRTFRKNIAQKIEESTFELETITSIVATGVIKKDSHGYIFEVSKSHDVIRLKHIPQSMLKKVKKYSSSQAIVTLEANIEFNNKTIIGKHINVLTKR